jgi:hypothetical protein
MTDTTSSVIGRPTKYSELTNIHTQEYLDYFTSKEYRRDIEEGGYMDEVFPSIQGLAIKLQVSQDTLYTWRKDINKKEFSDIIKRLLDMQAKMLLNQGLTGRYNHTISKLILSKHGYHDKIVQELEITDTAALSPVDRQARINALLDKGKRLAQNEAENLLPSTDQTILSTKNSGFRPNTPDDTYGELHKSEEVAE